MTASAPHRDFWRLLAFASVVAALFLGNACLTFDGLPTLDASDGGAPDGADGGASDAAGEAAAVDAAAPDAGTPLLDSETAGTLCAKVVQCPYLGASIVGSFAVPVVTVPDLDTTTFSWCMTWLNGPVDPMRPGLADVRAILQDVAAAADCSTANALLPLRVPPVGVTPRCPTETCEVNGDVNRCSIEITCGPPIFPAGVHCAVSGATAACVPSAGGACVPGCEDDAVTDCTGGTNVTFHCRFTGRKCSFSSVLRLADCVGYDNAAPITCNTDTASLACEGAHAIFCASKGLGTRYDCGAVGANCVTTAKSTFCAIGTACDPFGSDMNLCDSAGNIKTCVAGVPTLFSCAGIGKTCGMTTGTAPTATCL